MRGRAGPDDMGWGSKEVQTRSNKEDFRDLTWATQYCNISWNSIGMGISGIGRGQCGLR